MDNSLVVEGFNVGLLSDDELVRRLQDQGFIPGPITATTRAVYQRKLARMLRNEEFPESDTNEIPDDEISPAPTLNQSSSSFTSSTPLYNYDELRRRPLSRVEGENWSDRPPVLSTYKPWSMDDIVTRATPPPPEPEQAFVSPTVKIFLIIALLMFVFIVYYNMESAPANPLP